MENNKVYPYQNLDRKHISKEDEVFSLLLWCGMSGVDAYRFAYKTDGKNNSLAAMASRKRKEPQIERYFRNLEDGLRYKIFKFKN